MWCDEEDAQMRWIGILKFITHRLIIIIVILIIHPYFIVALLNFLFSKDWLVRWIPDSITPSQFNRQPHFVNSSGTKSSREQYYSELMWRSRRQFAPQLGWPINYCYFIDNFYDVWCSNGFYYLVTSNRISQSLNFVWPARKEVNVHLIETRSH